MSNNNTEHRELTAAELDMVGGGGKDYLLVIEGFMVKVIDHEGRF
jgi:hypothetical protein